MYKSSFIEISGTEVESTWKRLLPQAQCNLKRELPVLRTEYTSIFILIQPVIMSQGKNCLKYFTFIQSSIEIWAAVCNTFLKNRKCTCKYLNKLQGSPRVWFCSSILTHPRPADLCFCAVWSCSSNFCMEELSSVGIEIDIWRSFHNLLI